MYQAVRCVELGKDFDSAIHNLVLASVPQPSIAADEVRIRMIASALNFPDLLRLVGKYQYQSEVPFTTGLEGSGVIVERGSSVQSLSIGDEVMVGMVDCSHASEIVVAASQCVRKPKYFSHAEASGLLVGFCTAYHALCQRGNLQKGETLLVTGAAGGMGLAAIQLGKLMGATVIAGASSDEKVQRTLRAGADMAINYSEKDLGKEVKRLTDYKGVDVVYEVVGGDIFDKCTRCMNGGGRLLVVGFASGRIPKIPANLPLIKGYSVVGVRAGAEMMLHQELTQEMYEAIDSWAKEGALPPPVVVKQVNVQTEGKGGVQEAFMAMAKRKAVGKIVLLWDTDTRSKL